MKKFVLIVALLVILAGGAYFFTGQRDNDQQATNETTSQLSEQAGQIEQVKAAHFESSTPAHGAKFAGVPNQVVIDFNFDLSDQSAISIKQSGQEYGEGDTTIDENKLAMRLKLKLSAPNGVYEVTYKACWPDNSCHNGKFSFTIDRTLADNFIDMRSQSEITIKMSQIKFQPENLIITKGTKVTWVNDDTVDHFVNTDSHPAHTHQPDLNSRSLRQGASYNYTFAEAGLYPYHCSAHANNMAGNILVE
jgi:plastocyanin